MAWNYSYWLMLNSYCSANQTQTWSVDNNLIKGVQLSRFIVLSIVHVLTYIYWDFFLSNNIAFKNCWADRALVLKEWVEELLVEYSEKYFFTKWFISFFVSKGNCWHTLLFMLILSLLYTFRKKWIIDQWLLCAKEIETMWLNVYMDYDFVTAANMC